MPKANVSPPDPSNQSPKRKSSRRFADFLGMRPFADPTDKARRLGTAEFEQGIEDVQREEEQAEHDPSHGLPEAELTEEQREAAAEKMKLEYDARRSRESG